MDKQPTKLPPPKYFGAFLITAAIVFFGSRFLFTFENKLRDVRWIDEMMGSYLFHTAYNWMLMPGAILLHVLPFRLPFELLYQDLANAVFWGCVAMAVRWCASEGRRRFAQSLPPDGPAPQ